MQDLSDVIALDNKGHPIERVKREAINATSVNEVNQTAGNSTFTYPPINSTYDVPITTISPFHFQTKIQDDHIYYTSTLISNDISQIYIDILETFVSSTRSLTHLSRQHRMAVRVNLKFDFLFYGHSISSITIATGGFLYMSDFLHIYLTYSQYIAPLMADFTTIEAGSEILYSSTESIFIVTWKDVTIANHKDAGKFTFHTVLFKNGTIMFAYDKLPLEAKKIPQFSSHAVKIGLSDAYYHDAKTDYGSILRYISSYHKVEIDPKNLHEKLVIIFVPAETCVQQRTCSSCIKLSNFDCIWCESLYQCSSGMDRYKQMWEGHNCHTVNAKTDCDFLTNYQIALLTFLGMIFSGVVVFCCYCFYYAYKHPESSAGRWLIRNRPSQLRARIGSVHFFKKGENSKYRVSLNTDSSYPESCA